MAAFEFLVAPCILLSLIYPATNLVKCIATEKELQLKEAMKIMGLPNWLHWTGWFAKSMIFFTVTISLIVLLLKVNKKEILTKSKKLKIHWL